MKIPKKIKIGPHTYSVVYESGLNENHSVLGQSRHAKGIIAIDPEQTDSQKSDTLIHEILHCINFQVGFAPKDRDGEEDAVSRLAPILYQVLKENDL